MQYRAHIDGLRTIAIVPVVLFHADIALLSGGFTGVDVFFVISGFLITSLIVKELNEGRFSVLEFYKRRALRILPAYMAMIAAVIIASWFLLFPEETRALGRSIIAASFFVSNIYFWRTSHYFAPDVKTAPLLHTWTLSVEEQFYILLPIFLMIVAAWFGRRYVIAIAIISAISFAISLWGVHHRGIATFYLLPTRAWEFGIGALAAVTVLGSGTLGGRWRPFLALLGAGLIAWGVFTLDGKAIFPGMNALYPTIGAVLLIAFAQGNWIGSALSVGPMVYIGKISYSLYLWHWPIIVFWRMYVAPVFSIADVVSVVALSVLAASLSYHFIEQPFRMARHRRSPAPTVNLAAAASLCVSALAGVGLLVTAEHWGNTPRDLRQIASYYDYNGRNETLHPCFIAARVPGRDKAYDPSVCLAPGSGKPTLLMLGDSHAEHLVYAIETLYPDVHMQVAASTGCRPLLGMTKDGYCQRVLRPALEDHVRRGGVDTVLLSARWLREDLPALKETVAYLLDHVDNVVIFGPTPEYLDSFAILAARTIRRGHREVEHFLDPRAQTLDEDMRDIDFGRARYVSIHDVLCPDHCRHFTEDGIPIIYDKSHYTRAGSLTLVEDLLDTGLVWQVSEDAASGALRSEID